MFLDQIFKSAFKIANIDVIWRKNNIRFGGWDNIIIRSLLYKEHD